MAFWSTHEGGKAALKLATSFASNISPPTDSNRKRDGAPVGPSVANRVRSVETLMVVTVMPARLSHSPSTPSRAPGSITCNSAPVSRAEKIGASDALNVGANCRSKRSSGPRHRSLICRPMSKSTARWDKPTTFGIPVDPDVENRHARCDGLTLACAVSVVLPSRTSSSNRIRGTLAASRDSASALPLALSEGSQTMAAGVAAAVRRETSAAVAAVSRNRYGRPAMRTPSNASIASAPRGSCRTTGPGRSPIACERDAAIPDAFEMSVR